VRTTLVATAIVAVALGVAAAALVGVLRASLNESAEAEPTRRAFVVADQLTTTAVPRLEIVDPDVRVVPATPTLPADEADQTVPGELVSPAEPASPALPASDPATTLERWPSSVGFATAAAPAVTPGGPVTVQARASLQPAAAALDSLRALLLPGIPALLLLVAGLTWLAVGRALAPVTAIRRELADITANDLHRRVPVPRGGDEIAALAATTNDTLDRLESAVERHRRFVADAAHELRSPLAIPRTRMELAPPQPLTTEALTDLDRIQRLAADLLVLAGLDAGELPARAEVDLGQLVAEEAVRTRARAEVTVLPDVEPGLVVHGSAEHLRGLVANLVDNAVRHAERRVEVRLTRAGGGAVPPCSRWSTTALASRSTSGKRSSTGSPGSTRPGTGTPAGPASGWRSPATSRCDTGAASWSPAARRPGATCGPRSPSAETPWAQLGRAGGAPAHSSLGPAQPSRRRSGSVVVVIVVAVVPAVVVTTVVVAVVAGAVVAGADRRVGRGHRAVLDLHVVADLQEVEERQCVGGAEVDAAGRGPGRGTGVEGDAAVLEEHRVGHRRRLPVLQRELRARVVLVLAVHAEDVPGRRVLTLATGGDRHWAPDHLAALDQPSLLLTYVDAGCRRRGAGRAGDLG